MIPRTLERTDRWSGEPPGHGLKMAYLSTTDIFRDLAPEDIREIDRMTAMTACKRGKVIYQPGRTGEVLFILKKGRVNTYRIAADGRKLITSTIGPHTVFGEMNIIGQGMQDTFAEAAEDCVLCVMSRSDVEHLLLTRPSVGLRLLEVVAARLRDAEERLESVTFRSVPARLASLLLRLSEGQPEGEISGLSHQHMAELTGTYRETVSRILGGFRAGGLIEMGRMKIRVTRPEELEAVAEE